MAEKNLFGELPEQIGAKREAGVGAPRLWEPERDAIELRAMSLDSLIGADHPARLIWAYVLRLDLRELEKLIKAREGVPGHPAITPRLLLGLWLYATSEGVVSARLLARLCERDDVYRWFCGGVGVNHRTLGEFRVDHGDLLNRLLAQSVTALAAEGLIDLDMLAQDGVRVRASAGASSFRRRARLEQRVTEVTAILAELAKDVESDPTENEPPETKGGKRPKEPRVSTTDPEARVIKMADGGFRPAYNMQVASVAGEQIVVAVEVSTSSSDRGLARPILEKVEATYGELPNQHLVDGGYSKNDDIEWAHGVDVAMHCPPIINKHNTDPFAPREDDGPGISAWRQRMNSEAGKATYRKRSIHECINARLRQWGLVQLTVRGRAKALVVLTWYALVNNILQGERLRRAAA